MKINFCEQQTCTRYSTHDIDEEQFIEWLSGDEPTKEALEQYIYEIWEPSDEWTENYETDDGYIDESDTFINSCLDEIKELSKNRVTIF